MTTKFKTQLFFFIFMSIFWQQSAFSAEGEATYRVSFQSLWNQVDHISFPGNAHFSDIIAVNHNADYQLFAIGGFATAGMEDLAELGATRKIIGEINQQIRTGSVTEMVITDAFFPARDGDTVSFEIVVSKDSSLISFATMIAPSPDWIVGIDSFNAIEDGKFVENYEQDLFAINAGTEEGDFGGNFSINNDATRPIDPITFLQGRGLDAPFAKVVIERIK